jgi:hypothetical protein
MFRRSVFDQLHLEANPVGWAVTFEMALKAQLAGLSWARYVISIDRLYGGKSTFETRPMGEGISSLVYMGVGTYGVF